ncbi:DUF4351 domain-containing protein [Candidatus Thiosymbion oneisti]|uniref:DUF4351 domain-containing protein n=1 Tax=Candidatus Thiosymbion oneisti TaxID=589554 RepID=UPI003F6F5923
MTGFAERFIEQGRQQGRLEGRQQGRLEGRQEGKQAGQAAILLRQLQLKFGVVPEAVRRKIERADSRMLLVWSERVLTAAGIEQVVGD